MGKSERSAKDGREVDNAGKEEYQCGKDEGAGYDVCMFTKICLHRNLASAAGFPESRG